MRYLASIFSFLAVAIAFSACEKIEKLPFYPEGKDFTLTLSSTSIAPATTDSTKKVLELNWTSPGYPMDDSKVKYVVEVDIAGNGFKDALSRTMIGKMDTSFIGDELNRFVVGKGLEFNKPHKLEARVISSYENNNDQKKSNSVEFTYTPYLVPPEVDPPASRELYIVGSATAGGWTNPVPASQKFTMIDTVTYEGTFFMNANGAYLLLPENGSWDKKYSVENSTIPGLAEGGDFKYDGPSDIPGPAESGFYKIRVDFQAGKFTVTKVGDYAFLYVPGDYQGWSPETAPRLGSPAADQKYQGFVNVPGGGSYEFKFTTAPNWDNSLGDAGGGNLSPSGGNLQFPGEGYYFIEVNTENNTWSLLDINTWGLIGSFAASGWGTDVPMTYNEIEKRWTATITTADNDEFKFRANNSWDFNFGEDGSGSLRKDGDNIKISAGTHKISLFLDNAGYYTYTIE